MNSAPFYLPQAQLEAAETESLRRLARYLKLNNFKELEHYELAWVLSMILADQFFDDCDPYLKRL